MLFAYFIAFIEAQIGPLNSEHTFQLWPKGHFETHLTSGRLRKVGAAYRLSDDGVNKFTTRRNPNIERLTDQLSVALRSGLESDLPADLENRTLRQLDITVSPA